MKLEKLVGDRFKEKPSDCVVDSHAFEKAPLEDAASVIENLFKTL